VLGFEPLNKCSDKTKVPESAQKNFIKIYYFENRNKKKFWTKNLFRYLRLLKIKLYIMNTFIFFDYERDN
jgi:hypothetical protein